MNFAHVCDWVNGKRPLKITNIEYFQENEPIIRKVVIVY